MPYPKRRQPRRHRVPPQKRSQPTRHRVLHPKRRQPLTMTRISPTVFYDRQFDLVYPTALAPMDAVQKSDMLEEHIDDVGSVHTRTCQA